MDTIAAPQRIARPDPRVQAAIGHWAPRFVANGVPLTDFQEVTAGIERWDEWCAAWCARAAVHEALARNITCPLFIVTGKLDRLVPWQHAERLAAEASGPVVKLILEDGNHVANNRAYKYRPQSADWMARQLGLPPV